MFLFSMDEPFAAGKTALYRKTFKSSCTDKGAISLRACYGISVYSLMSSHKTPAHLIKNAN